MTKPIAQISFTVDVEIEYDPFTGRTPEQFADVVHDDLIDSLAYIDQLANIAYTSDFEEEEYQLLYAYAGY